MRLASLALLCSVIVVGVTGGRALPAIAAGCDTPGTPTTTVYLPNITKTLGGPAG